MLLQGWLCEEGEGREEGEGGRRKLRADGKCVFVSNVDNLSSDNTLP